MKLESTTGDIRFALGLARGAVVEMETHSGAIDVQLSRKTAMDVDAATVTGAIDNLWSKMRPTVGSEGRGMTFTSQSGGMGGRVVLRSFKGRITLR